MRRLMLITAFALSLAVPLWAQHGGGRVGGGGGHAGFGGGGHVGGFGGGHPGGFGGGHVGGFGGGHPGFGGGHFGGGHFGSGRIGRGHIPVAPRFHHQFSRGITRNPPVHAGFSRGPFMHDRFRGDRFRQHRFRDDDGDADDCFGFGCRLGFTNFWFPWWWAGYNDPWWWWGSDDSSYDEDYERDRALANEMNQQSLEEQRMRRQEEADNDQDEHARPDPAQREPASASVTPATVLVFRDQHQREIQNYAIVGQTLWNFAPQRTEKISLADLDLTATAKANDDRGISFRVPSASQAQ